MPNSNKIKSLYLNEEIEIPLSEFDSDGQRVVVIPYSVLDEVISNNPKCVENEVEAHYTQVQTCIPNHYAFFCRISDNKGRSVEGFGESLPETLLNKIARENPAKMAVKRAFSDAAIKFLRLPKSFGDVAGVDMEIVGGDGTTKRDRTAAKKSAPIPELDEALTPDDDLSKMLEEASRDLAPEAPEAPEAPVEAEKPAEEPAPKKRETSKKAAEEAPAPAEKPAEDPAPVATVAVSEDDADPFADFPDLMANDPFALDDDSMAKELEETPDVVVTAPLGEEPGEEDVYDTTIVTVGSMKAKNYSIRQCYAADKNSIHWIAEKMVPRREEARKIQQLCRDFLKLVGDE